ncbi:hypothetical protein FPZ24_01260 [Sphingomonas panacisoli]|uniref:Uncharacterized protein n=1 Tax=Sphingomonas panacisoli TaxID=1813879 RepID=A0A5B8LED5_9SPHN|nr:hypothetical protein [Sphingomonas panacisoli]QDZ06269.1 hypothetical protein FPZ24_01260 [Sphingomonas panacisoli]
MTDAFKTIAIAAAMTIGAAAASPAFAADNAMKVCGAKYQAAKTAKTIPAGETWNQFLAQCRGGMAKPAAVTTPAKPAPAVAAKPAKVVTPAKPATAPGQPTAAQSAMYARERQCGTQWKADKAAKKVSAGETWPQYWSACNKRMK